MTLAELKALIETMKNLPCAMGRLEEVQVRNTKMVEGGVYLCLNRLEKRSQMLFCPLQALLQPVEEFQSRAQQLLSDRDWKRDSPPEQLRLLLDEGAKLPVVVPECDLLQGLKEQGHWLAEVRRTLGSEGGERQEVTLEVLRNLMEAGCNVAQSVSVETAMAELQELLTIAERWEEKAQICLEQRSAQRRFLRKQPGLQHPLQLERRQLFVPFWVCPSRQKHPLSTLDAIVNEAQLIPVKLPNILALQGCLSRARAWATDLEEIQVVGPACLIVSQFALSSE